MNTNSPIADTGGDLTVEVEYIDRGSSGEIVDLVTGRGPTCVGTVNGHDLPRRTGVDTTTPLSGTP